MWGIAWGYIRTFGARYGLQTAMLLLTLLATILPFFLGKRSATTKAALALTTANMKLSEKYRDISTKRPDRDATAKRMRNGEF